ncbi:hypothetical protein VPH35_114979 [Triticum aestivum]
MAKRTGLAHAPTLLSLLFLMCFAIHVHCRIMDVKINNKINFPHGLCVHKSAQDCPDSSYCDCCLVRSRCYRTMDICVDECKKTSSGTSTTPTHLPFPSHTF